MFKAVGEDLDRQETTNSVAVKIHNGVFHRSWNGHLQSFEVEGETVRGMIWIGKKA